MTNCPKKWGKPSNRQSQALNFLGCPFRGRFATQFAPSRVGPSLSLSQVQDQAPALKFSGLFPAESGEFDNMKTAFERLSLNDAALFYEPENSATRCCHAVGTSWNHVGTMVAVTYGFQSPASSMVFGGCFILKGWDYSSLQGFWNDR